MLARHRVQVGRAGDERVGRDIAAALAPAVLARRSSLYYDGGDFLADSDTFFVMPRILQRNIQQTAATREEFLAILSRELKRRVILLGEAPDHHAGMFMASVGGKTMLVGDPGLAREFMSTELPLNATARKVWESLGYEICPVDCTSAYRHFGCLHCLVNVLHRS